MIEERIERQIERQLIKIKNKNLELISLSINYFNGLTHAPLYSNLQLKKWVLLFIEEKNKKILRDHC